VPVDRDARAAVKEVGGIEEALTGTEQLAELDHVRPHARREVAGAARPVAEHPRDGLDGRRRGAAISARCLVVTAPASHVSALVHSEALRPGSGTLDNGVTLRDRRATVEEKWGAPVRTGGGGFTGVWALYKNGMRVRYEDATGRDRQSRIHDLAISNSETLWRRP
jgi:hypothetical protein